MEAQQLAGAAAAGAAAARRRLQRRRQALLVRRPGASGPIQEERHECPGVRGPHRRAPRDPRGADRATAVRAGAGADRDDAAPAAPVPARRRALPALLGGLLARPLQARQAPRAAATVAIGEAKRRLALLKWVGPEFDKIHPIDVDDPEECYHLFRSHFLVPPGFDFAYVPSYWRVVRYEGARRRLPDAQAPAAGAAVARPTAALGIEVPQPPVGHATTCSTSIRMRASSTRIANPRRSSPRCAALPPSPGA